MKLNSDSFMHRHKRPLAYLKWNITKLPKVSLSPSSSKHKTPIHLPDKFFHHYISKTPKVKSKLPVKSLAKYKLCSSIYAKQIFVMLDGSSVLEGKKPEGFNHQIYFNSTYSRNYHLEEMKEFFQYCKEKLSTSLDLSYAFSHNGKKLKCLHELPSDSKIVIVSDKTEIKGITQRSKSEARPGTKILQEAGYLERLSPQFLEKINSQFEYSTKRCLKSNENILPIVRQATTELKRFEGNSKLNSYDRLKMKLSENIAEIEKAYPHIFDIGLAKLKNKYQFPEGKLHSLNAKFKALVLLSCAINPSHEVSSGISRVSFIDFNKTSKEQSYVLERIFDTFDVDSGGTISWHEFMSAMRIIHHGSHEEKIDLFFSVYDKNGDGSLSFTEIQELCKVQLQAESSDELIEELSQSFASLIFDITKIPYSGSITASKIKEVVTKNHDQSLIDMFCSFQFLKF